MINPFSEWPFAIVPTKDRAHSLWAGREKTLAQIHAMMTEWQISRYSTINLLWADLGAGKTHTLWYIEGLCGVSGNLYPIYVELPDAITDFVALYQVIAGAIDWKAVSNASHLFDTDNRTAKMVTQALKWKFSEFDSNRKATAEKWLRGRKLTQRESDSIGVLGPIKSAEEAIEVLEVVISALSRDGSRVVLMIDEYNRVAEGNRQQLQRIGHGVHRLFNICPRGLSLLLSCATGGSDDYASILTDELTSRLSQRRVDLPYLSAEDAVNYIKGLFRYYISEKQDGNDFFPLEEASTRDITEFLVDKFGHQLTPRALNQVLGDLLLDLMSSSESYPVSQATVNDWIKERQP